MSSPGFRESGSSTFDTMSATGQNADPLKLDIQHELITANHLLDAIKMESESMKDLTSPGGQLETVLQDSLASVLGLAKFLKVNLNR